jgi:hypothetical protein
MATTRRSHQLFLSSANRQTGLPHDYVARVESIIRCEAPDEYITVTPNLVSVRRSWDLIDESNRRLVVVRGAGGGGDGLLSVAPTANVTLPVGGGYTALRLRDALSAALAAAGAPIAVADDDLTNQLTLTPPDDGFDYGVVFSAPSLASILGWAGRANTGVFSHAQPAASTTGVRTARQAVLAVHTDLLADAASVMDNLGTKSDVVGTGVTLVVPLVVPWLDQLTYVPNEHSAYTLRLAQRQVTSIHISVRDESDEFVLVPDWLLGLRFDVDASPAQAATVAAQAAI